MRQIREEKGWTLERAEEEGWPSWQHLQKIELGQKNITFTTIDRLEKLYQIA
jgi:transcriptional regulator with XRE-family HTH domain